MSYSPPQSKHIFDTGEIFEDLTIKKHTEHVFSFDFFCIFFISGSFMLVSNLLYLEHLKEWPVFHEHSSHASGVIYGLIFGDLIVLYKKKS